MQKIKVKRRVFMRVLGKIKTCVAAFALGAIVITSSSMIAEALSLGGCKV